MCSDCKLELKIVKNKKNIYLLVFGQNQRSKFANEQILINENKNGFIKFTFILFIGDKVIYYLLILILIS